MSFGDYLRNAREQRDVTLDELWRRTKVRRHLLLELEEDDLSRWPKYLVYRHGYIRSIADYSFTSTGVPILWLEPKRL